MSRYAIHSRRTVTPRGVFDKTLLIEDGLITMMVDDYADEFDCTVEDVGDFVLMPGIVDSHVHINDPGTDWEGFDTASKAAAAGGITTLVDMPLNSLPVTTDAESFRSKLNAARGKLNVDCGFWGGIVPDNAHKMVELLQSGVLGIKAFLIDSGLKEFPNVSEGDLRKGMRAIADSGLPLLVHSELSNNTESTTVNNYTELLASRPRKWENDAIALMIKLCEEYNCRTHIVHLSSSESIAQIKDAKSRGLPLSVETCPHYLYFNAEDIPIDNTLFKCAPPIREKENNELLWEAIKDGVIDLVVTDHSPAPPNLKAKSYNQAWGGISGLQFSLPVFWTVAKKYGLTLENVSALMCEKPAELAGIGGNKGKIAVGYQADFCVWDPDSEFRVSESMIEHRHKITPYLGRALKGVVKRTYLRGEKIYDDGAFVSLANGNIILAG
ncbi:MAG TPA: allantoinase AllB [Flavobacteriales bacterium]|nr:allantoinase AllB [Flavobacteriales bacterium]